MGTFDWERFARGEARFCGGIRGADEEGHETFAVKMHGKAYFGEIRKAWIDDDHFDLEVPAFGYLVQENVGIALDPRSALVGSFEPAELETVKSLVADLARAFVDRDDRPFVMSMGSPDEFTGTIRFPGGWALSGPDGAREA